MDGITKAMVCFRDGPWFAHHRVDALWMGLLYLTWLSESGEGEAPSGAQTWDRTRVTSSKSECASHSPTAFPFCQIPSPTDASIRTFYGLEGAVGATRKEEKDDELGVLGNRLLIDTTKHLIAARRLRIYYNIEEGSVNSDL